MNSRTRAIIGSSDLETKADGAGPYVVDSFYIYEKFKPASQKLNIALVRLQKEVSWTKLS